MRLTGVPSRHVRQRASRPREVDPGHFQCAIALGVGLRATRPGRPGLRTPTHSEAAPDLARLLGDVEEEVRGRAGADPLKRARSSGSWVAMPTGQVLEVTGAHHHAAARDERSSSTTRPRRRRAAPRRRRPGPSSAARPSAPRCASGGRCGRASAASRRGQSPQSPAKRIEDKGDAPVPPSCPEIST